MTASQAPHAKTEACVDTHCRVHGVHEPSEVAYHVCFECNHVYRTARALRRDYRRAFWRNERQARKWSPLWPSRDRAAWVVPWWVVTWRLVTARASRITYCQHCHHDF